MLYTMALLTHCVFSKERKSDTWQHLSVYQLRLVLQANSRQGDVLDLVSGGEADHGAVLGVLGFSLQILQFQPLVHRLLRGKGILPIQVVSLKVDHPLHHREGSHSQ